MEVIPVWSRIAQRSTRSTAILERVQQSAAVESRCA